MGVEPNLWAVGRKSFRPLQMLFFFFFSSQFLKANWRGDEGGMAFWDSIQGERLMAAGGRSQREEEGALLRL